MFKEKNSEKKEKKLVLSLATLLLFRSLAGCASWIVVEKPQAAVGSTAPFSLWSKPQQTNLVQKILEKQLTFRVEGLGTGLSRSAVRSG